MKKVFFAVLFCALVLPAMAVTPVKLSLWDGIAFPNENIVRGVELGIGGNTDDIAGVQFNVVWAKNQTMAGWQASWVFNDAGSFSGLQTAPINKSVDISGVSIGLVNMSYNITGFQLGFFNMADRFSGLQLGFINYARDIDRGIQLGLVNFAENGFMPVMLFINGRF
ncbi:hypothetical protein Emin_0647 [Elusimicrobium minutum Pei191]|uniref:Uncharacterized protein n=1 Tax=Elusimicrobium minutum (strain Pei191) TaxID=445932 RepID=B2KC75_ELUMP|nr:hypothetical protein [Elusimicrobium minutum]ACC98202.1 hypothetical protein Emin_0647 [Elusimicrobium minutum Pei191]